MDLLPSINRIYSIVIQEESLHMNLTLVEDNHVLVNVSHKSDFKDKGFSITPIMLLECAYFAIELATQ